MNEWIFRKYHTSLRLSDSHRPDGHNYPRKWNTPPCNYYSRPFFLRSPYWRHL